MIAPNLSLISFVGVDKKTDLVALDAIKMSGIGLEFSVLYSEGRKGGRYSTLEFCKDFLGKRPTGFSRSLHLCGKSVINKFLAGDAEIMDLCSLASRIQLNFAMKKHDEKELIEGIFKAMDKGHHIILQLNKSKTVFVEKMMVQACTVELSLLHDSSGGFGRELTKAVTPREDHFTGYAGGIKPENVARIVKLIEDQNPDNIPYYIDMESGVREDNVFSLAKCLQVMEALS